MWYVCGMYVVPYLCEVFVRRRGHKLGEVVGQRLVVLGQEAVMWCGVVWAHTAHAMQRSTTQSNATQRNAKQRKATQSNATQHNAAQRKTTQSNAKQRKATQSNAKQRNATRGRCTRHTRDTRAERARRAVRARGKFRASVGTGSGHRSVQQGCEI